MKLLGKKWKWGRGGGCGGGEAGKRDKLGTCADIDTVELNILRCRANLLGTYAAVTVYMQ